MAGAVLCMAFYNVWSRRFIQRSSALGFLAVGMGAGAAALLLAGMLTGRLAALSSFGKYESTARTGTPAMGTASRSFEREVSAMPRISEAALASSKNIS